MTPGTIEPLRERAEDELRRYWAGRRFCTRCRRFRPAARFRDLGRRLCLDCVTAGKSLRRYWQRAA